MAHKTVPGLDVSSASSAADLLKERLVGMLDLQLTLKHIHWNVVGPNFISVHEMLDAQVGPVRDMTDAIAERIAILGKEPVGLPGHIVSKRTWEDYPLNRGGVIEHLEALNTVYDGVIEDHRAAAGKAADVDVVTEDLFISQTSELELYQWFVRSHIESTGQ